MHSGGALGRGPLYYFSQLCLGNTSTSSGRTGRRDGLLIKSQWAAGCKVFVSRSKSAPSAHQRLSQVASPPLPSRPEASRPQHTHFEYSYSVTFHGRQHCHHIRSLSLKTPTFRRSFAMARGLRRLALLGLAGIPAALGELTCARKASDQASYTAPSGAVSCAASITQAPTSPRHTVWLA